MYRIIFCTLTNKPALNLNKYIRFCIVWITRSRRPELYLRTRLNCYRNTLGNKHIVFDYPIFIGSQRHIVVNNAAERYAVLHGKCIGIIRAVNIMVMVVHIIFSRYREIYLYLHIIRRII